jgi:hypothetical protein
MDLSSAMMFPVDGDGMERKAYLEIDVVDVLRDEPAESQSSIPLAIVVAIQHLVADPCKALSLDLVPASCPHRIVATL